MLFLIAWSSYKRPRGKTAPLPAALDLVRQGRIDLFTHPQILNEIADILTRPKVQAKFPALTPEAVKVFLNDVEKNSHQIVVTPTDFIFERDPKDEIYVNVAVAAGARYLVTWDKDLLDFMDQEREEGKAFRSRFPGLFILSPVGFLQELAQKPGDR